MTKPLIGITVMEQKVETNLFSRRPLAFVNGYFLKLIKDVGGIPVLLPVVETEEIESLIQKLDAILLTSGEDIHPSNYNETLTVNYANNSVGMGTCGSRARHLTPNLKRDLFEIELYHQAKRHHLPILGICRGMQIINVAAGGTLYQEIPETSIKHDCDEIGWMHYHEISIFPDSRCCELIGTQQYVVSSIHHQAVNRLGAGIKSVAEAPDSIIEMIEAESDHFIVGIQSHPEQTMKNFPLMNKVFIEFIKQASLRKSFII